MSSSVMESEERYRILFEQTRDAITLVDSATGRILEANKSASNLFGFSKEEFRQLTIDDLNIHCGDDSLIENAGKETRKTQRRCKNGKTIDVEVSVQNIKYNGREVYQALWRDVNGHHPTDTIEDESEVTPRQKTAELKAIINVLPGLVFVVDSDFDILTANDETRRRLGYNSLDAFVGKKCYNAIKGLNTPCSQCNMNAAFEIGNMVSRVSTSSEEEVVGIATKAYAVPLKNEDGSLSGGVEILMDITDVRAIEKDLRESKERMQLALKGADLGLWDWNIETGRVAFNEPWTTMLGYSVDEIEPHLHSWERMVHPDDLPMVIAVLDRHLNGESPIYETEHRLRSKDGTWKWVLARGKVFERDKNGNPLRAAGTHLDITERRKAEEALRNSENLVKNILTASSVGLAHSVQRKIVWANEAMLEMFKFTREDQYLNMDTSMLYASEEEYRRIGKITYEQQKSSKVIEFDARFKRSDGTLFYGYVKVNQLDASDPLKGIIVSIVDITERTQIAEALSSEKERLAVTLRSIGDGVITTDTNSRIQTINKAAEKLTGWTQGEAIGRPLATVFNIIDELTRKKCANPVDKVLKKRGIVEFANHTLLVSRDGREYFLADSGAPIMDRNSDIIGVVLVFRDMTEKQKMLENTQRVDKLNSIGILAGGIAHDFNNLLGGIFGYVELAKETCDVGSKTEDYLNNALKTYARAKNLTQQLLTFSKGGSPLRKTDSLGPIIEESVKFSLSGSNVAASFDIADDLMLCDIDTNQIGQVIDNIVINAVQAMPLGGTLSISARNVGICPEAKDSLITGRYVRVSISDTGIGIPRSIVSRIFDPFFTTKQKGNGLGLATAYSIVKRHDGEITVESEQDKGTTLTIYLPSSEKEVAADVAEDRHLHQGSGKILIMDDEDYLREVAGEMLSTMGYIAEYAKNGNEALDIIKLSDETGDAFSAAIMDLTIPGGMGGKETVKRVREFNEVLPVFVTSGYSEDPVMANPNKYGFTDRIVKPYRREELTEMLYRHLGSQDNEKDRHEM